MYLYIYIYTHIYICIYIFTYECIHIQIYVILPLPRKLILPYYLEALSNSQRLNCRSCNSRGSWGTPRMLLGNSGARPVKRVPISL